ncbi:hypothetical protein PUNSTDRAFT_44305 [Punctularia strigosozonata HHB-11173 SS5]|uniref:uncharacterized protein n=1 Tax=Punctularia strigosozonata (strain HHB-11173) TaxID=741275 RepID=UPI000441739F|nr:uncharacterized protein PUNSTDRAFT_44305 [Punctularia strigosozonata HHB-11173 SS5]EIN08746.1 hypothetical protein PUNSTDRAFT_44305 [Punctularia strigosozonata HHB-11173 SS5]
MGFSETYCSFCAGPLSDAYVEWRRYLVGYPPTSKWPPGDGEWGYNPPGYPVPEAPVDDIVRISPEEGKYWKDVVSVGPEWPEDWVSPPSDYSDWGNIYVKDDDDEWVLLDPQSPHICIPLHRGCLSFLCRRGNVTPSQFWKSLYKPAAGRPRSGGLNFNGPIFAVGYYDMDGRNNQAFGYAVLRITEARWDDPDTMEDTVWLLSPPTMLPLPECLDTHWSEASRAQSSEHAACMKVFGIPELLDAILFAVVDLPVSVAAAELSTDVTHTIFDPPSLVSATKTILALCQVNRFFWEGINRYRQGLFLRLAWQYGWMLPCSPVEWQAWKGRCDTLDLRLEQPYDWRSYLLTFLRKEERHVRNRWRMHRMSVQFARGYRYTAAQVGRDMEWSLGQLGLRSSLSPPDAWPWEQSA